jgi:hypothetical protein
MKRCLYAILALRSTRLPRLALLLLGLACCAPAARAQESAFFGTLLPDPPGSVETSAYGINNAGQIVGLYFNAAGEGHGFVLTR